MSSPQDEPVDGRVVLKGIAIALVGGVITTCVSLGLLVLGLLVEPIFLLFAIITFFAGIVVTLIFYINGMAEEFMRSREGR